MNKVMNNLYQLLDSFKANWPKEKVRNMTLEEYTNLNKSDSFCYWLESKTQDLGSIWGGSAFKFGIYEKNQKEKQYSGLGRLSDQDYAWMQKYGTDRETAFKNVKNLILEIISASEASDLKAIDHIDLGDAVKWKIAFLYSNNRILNVFNKNKLISIADHLNLEIPRSAGYSVFQSAILNMKPENEDFFDFGKRIYRVGNNSVGKQYWLYSPGEQAYKWDEFYDEGIMALGWDKLDDLKSYESRDAISEALYNAYGGSEYKPNDTSANDEFANKMKPGDIIIVKKGLKAIVGYGEVESDYYYDENRNDYKHCRKVSWKKNGEWPVTDQSMAIKTLTDITSYLDDQGGKYYESLLGKMSESVLDQGLRSSSAILRFKKQIILQGPPGTGKTRAAKLIARDMLGLDSVHELESHEQFKLVQFHPGYAYEDFVRGIVAKPDEEGEGVIYSAENKTLAKFAEEARTNYLAYHGKTRRNPTFRNKLNVLLDKISTAIDNGSVYYFGERSTAQIIAIKEDGLIYNFPDREEIRYKVLFSDMEKIYDNWNEILKPIDLRELEPRLGLSMKGKYPYYYMILQQLIAININKNNPVIREELKNYVMVIDEINRANLSSVLGELIYALEYRGETVDSVYEVNGDRELMLPPNLYIIGTMNTADRSVGHIDYAIRRRFAFIEMLPESLSDNDEIYFNTTGFDAVARLFNSGNVSGEFKVKDVQLGHSYFIARKKDADTLQKRDEIFKVKMEYEVKPILLEYVKDGILTGHMDGQPVEDYIAAL